MWLSGEKWVLPQALSLYLPLWQCFLWLYISIACVNARMMTKGAYMSLCNVCNNLENDVVLQKKNVFPDDIIGGETE